MLKLNLNPYKNCFKNSNKRNCIYFSPEDITDKLSGGHLEILSDIYFLANLFNNVEVVYPSKNKLKIRNNILNDLLIDCKNIKTSPIRLNNSILSNIFISKNRLDIFYFLKNCNIKNNDTLIVSCHRNIFLHIILFIKYGAKNIVFKSHGSMITHNLENIWAFIKLKSINKNILKRIVSFLFYLFFENLSFLLSSKILLMRHQNNIKNKFYIFLLKSRFKENLIFKCASSLFFLKLRKKILNYPSVLNLESNNRKFILGSIADNTIPCNLLGLKILTDSLYKLKKRYSFDFHIRIAGKINYAVENIIRNKFLISRNDFEILGYIDEIPEFYNKLDALLVSSSGGSGIPIKTFESCINFAGPIYTNSYVEESAGELLDFKNNIFYDPELFIEFLKFSN